MNMKSIVLFPLFITMYLFLGAQGTCNNFHGQNLSVGTHYINCTEYECHSDGSMTGLPCADYACAEGKEIGYRETDYSKPFPECCGGPICA
ncbi:uncharacterized protein LOC122403290 [Colletes gigas]|uniref:uncharacterized protein LOC122403290 n=1 Tax=Colletes gigas TaxID=935657 RepID=UPI001C9B2CD0|nr:uncharacterized protein LOC122403290 [Colletes gigas]